MAGDIPLARRAHCYALPGGWTVVAGRTDQDNEYLTFRWARPSDWWFHVRGMPGSHVVLHGEAEGVEPDRETLALAAGIAAYHSKARTGGKVPVSCVRVRDVSKPRGVKPGTVAIRRERVLQVRPVCREGHEEA